jgi:hypothetical protein
MEHDQLLRSPFTLRILNPHSDRVLCAAADDKKLSESQGVRLGKYHCTGGGEGDARVGREGAIRCFPLLAARAHKNLLDLRKMDGARSMRAVWKAPGHPLP